MLKAIYIFANLFCPIQQNNAPHSLKIQAMRRKLQYYIFTVIDWWMISMVRCDNEHMR